MPFNHNRTTYYLFLIITVYLVLISIGIFYLALQGDTTSLGDPYYEDKILAHQRAFLPWLLTWFSVGLAAVIGCIQLYQRKRTKR